MLVVPLGPMVGDRLPLSASAAEALCRSFAKDAATTPAGEALRAEVVRRDGGRQGVTIVAEDIVADTAGPSLRLRLGERCDVEQRRGGRVEIWLQPPTRREASR